MDTWTLAAIAAMAAATYLCRAGGYLLFRAVKPPALVQTMLGYVPGALFVSYVVPALAAGAWHQWLGAAVTLTVMLATHSVSLAVLGGTAAAWGAWALAW